jgi:hypothetical protein
VPDVSRSLPVPVDDCAADRLPGSAVPSLSLPSTLGDRPASPSALAMTEIERALAEQVVTGELR